MAKILLGVNCNCFTNRYTEPEEWTRVCTEELGINTVQYSIDLLDPYYPWDLQREISDRTINECAKRNIRIKTNFGGHFSHQHYLGHPDSGVRMEAERWFKRMIDQTAYLDAEGTGTCFAIMSVKDNRNLGRRDLILNEAVEAYHRLAHYALKKGLKYLMFEPTSVPRESCSTIIETRSILNKCSNMAVPMRLCLDVGHRNTASLKPADGNHLEWIREFINESPVIHIQQTDNNGSHHWPFTDEYNMIGIINPREVLSVVESSELDEILLALEIKASAFSPSEKNFLQNLKISVEYWREFIEGI